MHPNDKQSADNQQDSCYVTNTLSLCLSHLSYFVFRLFPCLSLLHSYQLPLHTLLDSPPEYILIGTFPLPVTVAEGTSISYKETSYVA